MNAQLTHKPATSEIAAPLAEAWVERVFDRLTAQLGAKMADLYNGANPALVKAEWGDGLAGFASDEIKRGLKVCQTRIFAPTLGEFLRLCRPALDPELAWFEAVEGMAARNAGKIGEWTHPAVYRAAVVMAYEVLNVSYNQAKKSWAWRLEKEFAAGWGEAIPAPALRLTREEPKPAAPNAEQKQKIAELLAGRVVKIVPRAPMIRRPLTDLEIAAAQAEFLAKPMVDPAVELLAAEWAAVNGVAA